MLDELEYLKQLEGQVTRRKCSQAQNILHDLKNEFDTADEFYNRAGQFWEDIENYDLDEIEGQYMYGMGISDDWGTCERCHEIPDWKSMDGEFYTLLLICFAQLVLIKILDDEYHAFTEKYQELIELANENGVIKKVLKAGGNHFAVGPDFNEVGDPENYQFQDCSNIAEHSKYNRKSLEAAQFANGMEFGKYGMS